MISCSIGSQGNSHTWIGEVTNTNLLLSSLDSIFFQYDTKIILAFSTDIGIQIEIK